MYKWEDEKWDKVNLQAGYSRNDRRCMETYFVIPASRGKFHVYLEADGEFVVKHIGGDRDGNWLGNIAYDVSQRGWNIGDYKGCKISNYQSNTVFVAGHPDAEMNGKHFDAARAVEVDWFASFELTCDDEDGAWRIYPPPIQKDSSYNYTVSYGEYTEKYCEWGAVSVSIDEDNSTGTKSRIKPHKGAMMWSDPEKENSEGESEPETSQGKDLKTPDATTLVDFESDDNSSSKSAESIPDYTDTNPWSAVVSSKSDRPFKQEDDRVSTSSRLSGNLRRPGTANPQLRSSLGREKAPEPSESDLDAARIKGLPPPREQPPGFKPTRSISTFNPEPDLVEAWRPGTGPGYSKEDVAAATILAHGSIADGRSMLDKRDQEVLRSRSSWGTGGFIKKIKTSSSDKAEKLAKLSTAERREYELIKNSSGKTQAALFLEQKVMDR